MLYWNTPSDVCLVWRALFQYNSIHDLRATVRWLCLFMISLTDKLFWHWLQGLNRLHHKSITCFVSELFVLEQQHTLTSIQLNVKIKQHISNKVLLAEPLFDKRRFVVEKVTVHSKLNTHQTLMLNKESPFLHHQVSPSLSLLFTLLISSLYFSLWSIKRSLWNSSGSTGGDGTTRVTSLSRTMTVIDQCHRHRKGKVWLKKHPQRSKTVIVNRAGVFVLNTTEGQTE